MTWLICGVLYALMALFFWSLCRMAADSEDDPKPHDFRRER